MLEWLKEQVSILRTFYHADPKTLNFLWECPRELQLEFGESRGRAGNRGARKKRVNQRQDNESKETTTVLATDTNPVASNKTQEHLVTQQEVAVGVVGEEVEEVAEAAEEEEGAEVGDKRHPLYNILRHQEKRPVNTQERDSVKGKYTLVVFVVTQNTVRTTALNI